MWNMWRGNSTLSSSHIYTLQNRQTPPSLNLHNHYTSLRSNHGYNSSLSTLANPTGCWMYITSLKEEPIFKLKKEGRLSGHWKIQCKRDEGILWCKILFNRTSAYVKSNTLQKEAFIYAANTVYLHFDYLLYWHQISQRIIK